MGKPILIAVAALVGILGLAMTACGAFFAAAGMGAIALLIGIVPGALLMWLAYWLFKRGRAKSKPAQSSEQSPPDAG